MKFHYRTNNQKLESLLQKPLLLRLCDYLWQHREEEIILRQLKKEFVDAQFEKLLEVAVSFGLVERSERRYRLLVPVLTEPEFAVTDEDKKVVSEYLAKQSDVFLDNFLFHFFQERLTKEFLFLTTFNSPFFEMREVGNQELTFYHLVPEGEYYKNLVDFFMFSGSGQSLPTELKPFEELIGDVNPAYFFDYVAMIFEKVAKGKGERLRESIFLRAVMESQWLNQEREQILLSQVVPLDELAQRTLDNFNNQELAEANLYQDIFFFKWLMKNLQKESVLVYKRG